MRGGGWRCRVKASIALRTRPRTKSDIFSADEAFRPRSTHFNTEPEITPIAGTCDLDKLAILERQP
jgi:hypothetical protein